MSPDQFLDFALNQLDERERRLVSDQVEREPEQALRLVRLRQRLTLLLDDGPGPEPPRDLAARTIALVAIRREQRTILDYVPARRAFRLTDLAVAAGIFLAGLLTLVPAVHRSRFSADLASCQFNLQQLGVALIGYANTHHAFPSTSASSEVPYAGSFAAFLRDHGAIRDSSVLDCPGNHRHTQLVPVPRYRELVEQHRRSPGFAPSLRQMDYAYALGYRDANRPSPLPERLPNDYPLLADHPPHQDDGQALEGNSPNHGARGQNVLMRDGRVRFLRSRAMGGDPDIYRNRYGRTAMGADPSDYVLGSGPAVPRLEP
jgi:hypothetical protein